jgi:hypothetical protein
LKDVGRETEKGLFPKKDKKLTQAYSQLNQILHFLGTSSSSSSSSSPPLTNLANKKTPSLELENSLKIGKLQILTKRKEWLAKLSKSAQPIIMHA